MNSRTALIDASNSPKASSLPVRLIIFAFASSADCLILFKVLVSDGSSGLVRSPISSVYLSVSESISSSTNFFAASNLCLSGFSASGASGSGGTLRPFFSRANLISSAFTRSFSLLRSSNSARKPSFKTSAELKALILSISFIYVSTDS